MIRITKQLAVMLVVTPLASLSADNIADAKSWYENQYVPLWTNSSTVDSETAIGRKQRS